jgi:hypothetical protein
MTRASEGTQAKPTRQEPAAQLQNTASIPGPQARTKQANEEKARSRRSDRHKPTQGSPEAPKAAWWEGWGEGKERAAHGAALPKPERPPKGPPGRPDRNQIETHADNPGTGRTGKREPRTDRMRGVGATEGSKKGWARPLTARSGHARQAVYPGAD